MYSGKYTDSFVLRSSRHGTSRPRPRPRIFGLCPGTSSYWCALWKFDADIQVMPASAMESNAVLVSSSLPRWQGPSSVRVSEMRSKQLNLLQSADPVEYNVVFTRTEVKDKHGVWRDRPNWMTSQRCAGPARPPPPPPPSRARTIPPVCVTTSPTLAGRCANGIRDALQEPAHHATRR